MKKLALLTIFCALATGTMAAPQDGWNEDMTVFKGGEIDGVNGFRIPAITSTGNGNLVAVADYRFKNKDWNTDMGPNKENPAPYFVIKTSNDGGKTWIESEIECPIMKNPVSGKDEPAITDPSVVYNQETGSTFLFGYNNTHHIAVNGGKSDFFVYSSDDGGKTWSNYRSIKEEIQKQLVEQGIDKDKYENILQGPGSGLTYNGIVYVPIQMFNEGNERGENFTSTSGFIYSDDNGKSWKVATLEGILPQGDKPANTVSTSESNLFYHNGKICLAAKVENGAGNPEYEGKRVVFTYDNGKWERLEEDFLPDDMAKCETSSLSLSEQVYLVGYSAAVPDSAGGETRTNSYITTNTGRTIKILDGETYGYTSMTQDEDNLYVLFETKQGQADINMRKYDIASKEYANLNAQILERGQGLLDAQDKLFASRSYIGGEYANNSENGAEAVVLNGNYKIGAFHKKTNENSKDVYRTIEYKTEETTLVLSQDNVITKNDNIFIGYQYTDLEYANKSKNDINSFVIGYSLNHNLENDYIYHLGINGIYSNNKLKRNELEGVGRKADFDTYSISLRNELSKKFALLNDIDTKISFGLDTTVFGHDKIDEEGGIKTINGGKWNNAVVDKSKNISNEIYAGTELNKNIYLNEKLTLKLGANAEYRKELMDVDDWRDDFTVLDVTKKYATPVEKHEAGVFYTGISAGLDIADKVETSVSYRMDSTGENIFTGTMTYKF